MKNKNLNIKKYAAIDIGSNAIRLLIANVISNKITKEITIKKSSLVRVPVRLGEDSFTKGVISSENKKRLIKTMHAYKLLMDVHGVVDYRACATSAMREANNGKEIIKLIAKQAAINIEIIDGKEEASIIFATDIKNIIRDDRAYIYIDVGGGSTEITILDKGEIINSKSFKIGTVRLLKKIVDKKIWKDIEKWVLKNTANIQNIEAIGTGGNINKFFKMTQLTYGTPLKRDFLELKYQELKELSYADRIDKLGLNADRADVIVPAVKIYKSIMEWSNSEVIIVPKVGLSDGIIRKLIPIV